MVYNNAENALVALVKTFYGRYAGTEGNLKTEVIDVFLLEIPDPRNVDDSVLKVSVRGNTRLTD